MSLSKTQLEARKTGIGGSDIGALLVPDFPFGTAYGLWLEKTGRILPLDLSKNESIEWGIRAEPVIAEKYAEKFQVELIEPTETFRHAKYDFLIANPDRLIKGQRKGLEIKTTDAEYAGFWGESGTNMMAEIYVPQIMHYMTVLDYDEWDVAVVIGGNRFRYYHMTRDKVIEDALIEVARDFWENYVVTDIQPPHDWYHPSSKNILKRLYKNVEKVEIKLPASVLHWKNVWLESKSYVREYEKAVDGAQSHILASMKNAEVGILPDGTQFTRKEIKRKAYEVAESSYIDFRYKGARNNE